MTLDVRMSAAWCQLEGQGECDLGTCSALTVEQRLLQLPFRSSSELNFEVVHCARSAAENGKCEPAIVGDLGTV